MPQVSRVANQERQEQSHCDRRDNRGAVDPSDIGNVESPSTDILVTGVRSRSGYHRAGGHRHDRQSAHRPKHGPNTSRHQ